MPENSETSDDLPSLWTRSFALLISGTLFQGLGFYFLFPILPLYVKGPLHSGEDVVGLVVGVFSITALMARPFAGYWLDRFGRRTVLLLAAGFFCLSLFSFLLASNLWLLVVIRLMQGIGWGLVGTASATVAIDLIPPDRRGEGMGMYLLSLPLALAVGPLIGFWVLGESHFHRLFLCAGGLGIIALMCFSVVQIPPIRNPAARLTLQNIIEQRVLRLSSFMLVICLAYGGLMAFVPLYALHLGLQTAAPVFSAFSIGIIATRLFAGRWYDLRGPLQPCVTALVLLLIGWLGLGFAVGKVSLIGSATSIGLGFGILMPSANAMLADVTPYENRGAANATFLSSCDIGIAIGAVVFGLLIKHFGTFFDMSMIYKVSAVFIAASALLFWFFVFPHFQRNRLTQAEHEEGQTLLPD
jgi:MFS family permease